MDYISEVLKTESIDIEKIKIRIATRRNVRLLHCAIGMVTEAAEFLDALKKHFFYGKELDEVNLLEELGDNQWYVAIGLNELRKTFVDCQELNIKKLFKRYGMEFSEKGAIDRDLKAERGILENTSPLDKDYRSFDI
jgi:hypothetical protein